MILGVDIGNTTIYFGEIFDDRIGNTFRIATKKDWLSAEYIVKLRELLNENTDLELIKGIVISSVVPEITIEVEEALQKVTGKKSIVVKRDVNAPFKIISDCLRDLGADLIADSTGALEKYNAPLLVFDMGTATTCSVINRSQEFLGGIICPGLKTSSNALIGNASQLAEFELGNPKEVVGKKTPDCINSGVIYGHSEIINGLRRRIEEETNEKYTVILTGGNSDYVKDFVDKDIIQDKELIFYGLKKLYKMKQAP